MEHLLFKVFTGIYFLILSSAAETSNCNRVTHEDLITHINSKWDKLERKLDLINTNVETLDEITDASSQLIIKLTEELALAKTKIENIENGIQTVQSECSLNGRMHNSFGGSWEIFNNACIRNSENKILRDLPIETCKQLCREEGGRVCKSVTYHLSTKTCHFSGLGSSSDAYSQPCYLDGYDLYEYTESKCPKGYFKPQGSNQCYIGCPEGFFMLPAPSYQCLKFFNESTLSWDDANAKCLQEGLVLARPYDALTARKYIAERYAAVGVVSATWIGARGNGQYIAWQQQVGGEQLTTQNPLWWPGHPISTATNRCLRLLSDDKYMYAYPSQPYADHPCTDNTSYKALCELLHE